MIERHRAEAGITDPTRACARSLTVGPLRCPSKCDKSFDPSNEPSTQNHHHSAPAWPSDSDPRACRPSGRGAPFRLPTRQSPTVLDPVGLAV